MEELRAILHHAYGITRSNEGTDYPRPFRAAPSGGALYPLELFLQSNHLEGQVPGLYHYNPLRNELRRLQEGDLCAQVADGLVEFQSNLAFDTSLMIFLTAVFERSTFKYGRGAIGSSSWRQGTSPRISTWSRRPSGWVLSIWAGTTIAASTIS